MFPENIAQVASIAIENGEWNTAEYLIDNLYGWMDCPDHETGLAAAKIANCIANKTKSKTDDINILRLYNKFLKRAISLMEYAKASGVVRFTGGQ